MSDVLMIVAHEATRTGSPRVLIEQLTRARRDIRASLHVTALSGGPLEDTLNDLSDDESIGIAPRAVLLNSIASLEYLHNVDERVPVGLYVHEDDEAIDVLAVEQREQLVSRVDRILVVSERAHSPLTAMGVDPTTIDVLRPISTPRVRSTDADISSLRAELGWDPNTIGVLGCGEAGWRKGADLFIDVARQMTRGALPQSEQLMFYWVGRQPRWFNRILEHDTNNVGLSDRLKWVGEVHDMSTFFSACSVLVMCSRYDPQPLVTFEAAQCGLPTVGFDVGGLTELSHAGCAKVVPFPDTHGLADSATTVLTNEPIAHGQIDAMLRLRHEQYAPEVVVPKFVDFVNQLLTMERKPHS